MAYIEKQAKANKPFFLYVALLHLHPPMGVHPDFAGTSGGGMYADMLTEMDYRTGQILDALSGRHRRQYDRRVQQRQRHQSPRGRGWRFEWAVAGRLLQSAVRRELPGTSPRSLAWTHRGRSAQQ